MINLLKFKFNCLRLWSLQSQIVLFELFTVYTVNYRLVLDIVQLCFNFFGGSAPFNIVNCFYIQNSRYHFSFLYEGFRIFFFFYINFLPFDYIGFFVIKVYIMSTVSKASFTTQHLDLMAKTNWRTLCINK